MDVTVEQAAFYSVRFKIFKLGTAEIRRYTDGNSALPPALNGASSSPVKLKLLLHSLSSTSPFETSTRTAAKYNPKFALI